MFTYVKRGLLASVLIMCILLLAPHHSNADPAPSIPQIVSVTSPNENGAYKAGSEITIYVTYDKEIMVTGAPAIALNSGGIANYKSGSGSNKLVFMYIPQTGDNTTNLDVSSSNAFILNGGSILDTDQTPANLTTALPALSMVKNLVIDTVAPQAPVIALSTTEPTVEVTVTINYSSDTVDKGYQMWGDNPSIYTGPFVLTSNRTISAYATDAAGNYSESVLSIINIDTSPPTVRAEIAGGVHSTYAKVVKLAIDDLGTGAAYMQFSNDLGFWSEWEPYNQNKLYTLPPGAGQKTIYVKVKDAAGNRSESYSTFITLLEVGDVNLALYSSVTGYPQVTASFACCVDNGHNTVNGLFDYSDSSHDRWTNYGSTNSSDSLIYNFGAPKLFNQVKLYIFNDDGGVMPPASYIVQYWAGNNWAGVPNIKLPSNLQAVSNKDGASKENTVNVVGFDAISSTQLKITLNNGNAYVGLVELEVFLDSSEADSIAASPVISTIDNLPSRQIVKLSDSEAIQAARSAFETLTERQKILVTRLDNLVQAEAAIRELEGTLTDVSVRSAFSNGSGNEVTIKVASPLDISYYLQANLFRIRMNGEGVTASEAYFDLSDPTHQTIKLMISSPVLLDGTTFAVDIQRGAFRTSEFHLNSTLTARPIITFKQLDLTLDQLIGVDDIAQIASNPEQHIDVNHDGVFDGDDVKMLLSQISSIAK